MVGTGRSGLILLAVSVALVQGCDVSDGRRQVILLVTVDTLRADHLGVYGEAKGLTPRLDRLAAESTVFDAAYATSSFTLPSLASLVTSRYPEEVGVTGNSAVFSNDVPTLASWFAARGFRTGAVVSNYVLRAESGFDRGFTRDDATFPGREAVRAVPERVAPDTTDAALSLLDDLLHEPGPVLLWVHYQDPHGPYAPTDAQCARFLERERKAPDAQPATTARSLPSTRRSVRFSREFVLAASWTPPRSCSPPTTARDWARTTTGFRTVSASPTHSCGSLSLSASSAVRPPSAKTSFRLLDVLPTLATLAGSAAPEGVRGRDLFSPNVGARLAPVYMSTLRVSQITRAGVVSRGFKYLVESHPQGITEHLFRIGDESRDVSSETPESLKSLRSELVLARDSLRKVGTTERALSAEDQEKFKALGYLATR